MILDIGLVEFESAYKIQKECVKRRALGEIEDTFILAEHPSIFTLGRSANAKNLLCDESYLAHNNIKLIRIDRGGDITYHGRGQLVVYPIIDLKDQSRDLHLYLRTLEAIGISFLRAYNTGSKRIEGKTGVWVGDEKIIFIGVAASNWITYHGMSININTDLKYFDMINPCGMTSVKVTSLNKILGRSILMNEAKMHLRDILKNYHDFSRHQVKEPSSAMA